MNIEYKVKKCLKCGAETDSNDEEELFCSKCGAPVVNHCADYNCVKLLKEDAKFCKYCGSSSIFNNFGLLDTDAPKNSNNINDLPF
jgi:RNA polymerase subunit RPABC4/transcription elongation factor Spt4